MADLFENIDVCNVIHFIKETHFISNYNFFVLMFVIYFFYFS